MEMRGFNWVLFLGITLHLCISTTKVCCDLSASLNLWNFGRKRAIMLSFILLLAFCGKVGVKWVLGMHLFKGLEPQITVLVIECLSIVLFYIYDSAPDVSETRL